MIGLVLAAALDASAFSYDANAPLNISYGASTAVQGVQERAIHFNSAGGRTVGGVIVRGTGTAKHPVVLFVHWLGDDVETTNHTEFEKDAAALAKRGVTSLLIDAQWAQKDWFEKRTTDKDYQNSIDIVVDLRRSLDALLAQPNVDATRLAYVGHDFGSMYGAVLAGVDPRPQWYVLMAGTITFSEWYLLGKKPADIAAYEAQMAPLDPPGFLARAKAKGFFFQYSPRDRYIKPEKAAGFFGAAPLPKTIAWYDADHSLRVPQATADRLAWLEEKLALRERQGDK